MEKKLCLITFSNNADHQNVIYSMFYALEEKCDVYTIGITNPKSAIAPHGDKNFYFACPERPGIGKGTFRFSELFKIVKAIKENGIQYIYFESLHVWNILVMLLCRKCVCVEAIHDVIPHNQSKMVTLCSKLACKVADKVVLRNRKYKSLLAESYKVPEDKIICFEPWRFFQKEKESLYSKKFLCFGRIRKYKGFDLLEKIVQKSPNAQYQIVGEPDEESLPIVEALKQYSNVEVVDREVSDQEMEEYFTQADWIVLPYSSATQSGVIADSYRFSKPVIAFNVGAISEQIEDKKTGFLVPEADVEAFAQIVNEVETYSEEQVKEFSHNAYMYGYKKYAAEAVAMDFYSCITNGEN